MLSLAKKTISLGAIILFLAVLMGAFGAHALSELLEKNNRVDVFSTASHYHFYHGFALVLLGVLMQLYQGYALPRITALCFLMGVLLFSGSLYLLAIFNISWLGAITPVGGFLLLCGWIVLAYSIIKQKTPAVANFKKAEQQN